MFIFGNGNEFLHSLSESKFLRLELYLWALYTRYSSPLHHFFSLYTFFHRLFPPGCQWDTVTNHDNSINPLFSDDIWLSLSLLFVLLLLLAAAVFDLAECQPFPPFETVAHTMHKLIKLLYSWSGGKCCSRRPQLISVINSNSNTV